VIGWTPLHEASNHGRVSVARELLRAGADSNAQGLNNDSPLHDAAVNGHVEVCRFLADRSAARSVSGSWHVCASVRPSVCDEVYFG